MVDAVEIVPVDARRQDWPRLVAGILNRLQRAVRELQLMIGERDTDGNVVPVWKGKSFTYDGSGNLQTVTVTDGANTWVATSTYALGHLATESGWVKQP